MATQIIDTVSDTVTNRIDYLKDAIGQQLQTAQNIQKSTSTVIQSSINSSLNDWLQQHPTIAQLFNFIGWASSHPIWSLIIALFAIAIAGSIIRGMVRLIETASFSILKTPFKLIGLLIQSIWQLSSRFTVSGWNQITDINSQNITPAIDANYQETESDKQKRLTEISVRLAEIQSEQNALLAEAGRLLKFEEGENHRISDERLL